MTTADDIKGWIAAGLPNADITVMGDDGAHFEALVISADFEGKGTVARHRLVYGTLGAKMGQEIHALALKTQTPSEAGRE